MMKRQYGLSLILMIGMIVGIAACQKDEMPKEEEQSATEQIEERVAETVSDGCTDISSSVTTVPADSKVCDFGMVPLDANTTAIEGCPYVYKLDKQVPPDAEATIDAPTGFTGKITFKVTGNKTDGYTVEISDNIEGYIAVMKAVYFGIGNNSRKFTFDPFATYASPLPAPINPSGEAGDISHTHFCYDLIEEGEELTVTKTVVTSFTRTHAWDIAKKVETENGYTLDDVPKIWLYIDGSGDESATWTIDVTYESATDSNWKVSGEVKIENTGSVDAVITSVVDKLAGTPITLYTDAGYTTAFSVGSGVTIKVDEILTLYYSENVTEAITGSNEVTVTTERKTYGPVTEPIVWGDPTTELYKTVNIKDLSDLFGEQSLGSVTAPNDQTFTYDKAFAWTDYGEVDCGSFQYDNTATIVETEQSASASLKVNVQCYIYESAWAKGDPSDSFCENGFSNWGWTNPIMPGNYTWDLWAGAGQCDTSKGTLVGSVNVVYSGGNVEVNFNVDASYTFKDPAVYAGYGMFPLLPNGKETVAPGQYTNQGPFDGSQVYVIAHAVVGYPDPDFGPEE